MNTFLILLIAFLISAFISSFIAAFTRIPYKNKFSSQLSILENAVKNGNANFGQRLTLFGVNMIGSFVAPPVYIKALIIAVILFLILK
ncbi:hypothetical protein BZG01_21125 [Labilibaculum manganireducens]|uniref:Uncharacterized protein n=1 Tax=Labilibaculum manganireducens TaxID=1940525 RepID=A0A2N3HQI6_9BACT|nr:hypothetical protein [Labilibaculum manganireducens]PKQ60297.1 hypothetical protein BZG01_21125 [Labilibaculum manganireducens]